MKQVASNVLKALDIYEMGYNLGKPSENVRATNTDLPRNNFYD